MEGLGLGLGGGATWSWRGPTCILGFEMEKKENIQIAYDCIQIVTISAIGECVE